MIKYLTLFLFYCLLLTVCLNAKEFTVASYNVENLFDLKYDGTEYKEYKPCSEAWSLRNPYLQNSHLQNSKCWNKKTLTTKIQNISNTIKDLNADIIALQEIESKEVLALLSEKLPFYKYRFFLKNHDSSVGVAVLSKYQIIKTKAIPIDKFDKYARPILSVTVKIDNENFIIYNNHWRSKNAAENTRARYAVALKNQLINQESGTDYVLLGDFNSNYNEWQTFKYDKKLNNTYGITGINHILNTIMDDNLILSSDIMNYDKQVHYNLWLELRKQNRFSYKFRGENNTPDNMLLPKALFDNNNISYILNSFKVFKPNYLYKNKKINRWHKNKGYSDHLPIISSFTTDKINTTKHKIKYKPQSSQIKQLYNIEHITQPIDIKDIVVIYKFKKHAVIKQLNERAIYLYNCAEDLEIGKKYDLTVNTIVNHFGLLEVKEISKIRQKSEFSNYKSLYQDGTQIDIFDIKYTNDIVTNLIGNYKKGYLYLDNNKRIKLYFSKRFKKPRNNVKIKINSGHLGIYKSKVQILIHKKSDIKIQND